jgi:hypothetical protein
VRTKNAARITPDEADHMRRVKLCACVTCDAGPPSIAHHVVQGDHFTTVALCEPCHVGPGGIHKGQTMLHLRFKARGERGELLAINETHRRVAALRRSE